MVVERVRVISTTPISFSSSMKFSKSFLRPTRKGGAAAYLSFLRGGPLQPSSKKRGGAFDTHEPSSPKVTCIGQVRVKSKKRVKQCRRRIGEVSFRVAEGGQQARPQPQRFSSSRSHRDPRWVHLPMSALRAFGAEICCFFPCTCSCFPARQTETTENGCGAAFTRWLVAENGGDGEIEVVVSGGEEQRSFRHVFEDIVVKDDEEEEEESGRVSICIPPKNALLLMRCRSDPMKMTALATRFCLDASKHENPDILEEENENENDDFQEQVDDTHVAEQNMEVADKKIDESLVEEESSGDTVEDELSEEDKKAVECTEREEEEEAEKPKNGEMAIINGDVKKENNKGGGLPECLLLMMCEPKLSMEVSKETWIRGTDFIRLLPERPRKPAKAAADQEQLRRRPSVDSKSKPRIPAPPSKRNDQQPARSSCSLPMAAVIERNQAGEGKCEPFALTRCKSEPMSTAAAKLMPESC